MTDATAQPAGQQQTAQQGPQKTWNWNPPLPLPGIPIFVWPLRPLAAIKYLLSAAYLGSVVIPFGALAVLSWWFFQPALEACVDLAPGWIAQIFLRNLFIMGVCSGALHLYFYTFKCQGNELKFDKRDLARNNPRYLMKNQVLDNIFWTMVSGVTVWSLYEVLIFWAYANGWAPSFLDWREHPFLFFGLFFAIPFFNSVHFYLVHRLLHFLPIYKVAHALHHRNDNIGPWSGLSMHPLEHVIYLSSVLIHLLILSHPLHVIFHNLWNGVGAATTHTGFLALTIKGRRVLYLGSFHHQLHHRYYHCNYGNEPVPLDRWMGSDVDGTAESVAAMRKAQSKQG